MRKNNPAVYECKSHKDRGLHRWRRNEDRTATCLNCGLTLSVEDADDCFEDRERYG